MCKRTDQPNGLRRTLRAFVAMLTTPLRVLRRDVFANELRRPRTRRRATPRRRRGLASPEPTLRRAMRAPLTIMAVLAALLMGLWFLTGGDEEPSAPPRCRLPRPWPRSPGGSRRCAAWTSTRSRARSAVTPEQARREGLEDLDRTYPEARRRADEQVLKLLGLIDPSVDLRDVSASVFSEGVAGYYDPRSKRMRTVRGAATGTRVLTEMVLAHELTHALEDQRYGLGIADQGGSDDAALARLALVEGSASELMYAYAEAPLHGRGDARRGARQRVRRHRRRCPASCRRSSSSPTRAARRSSPRCASAPAAAGRWSTSPSARGRRSRPSRSCTRASGSAFEPPLPVRTGAAAALGPGWQRASRRGARGVPDARAALARGRRRVRGGRRGLGRGPLRAVASSRGDADCAPPCRRDAALVRALALGHAARLAGVRLEASAVGARRARRGRRRPRCRGGARRGGDARDGADRWAGAAPRCCGAGCGWVGRWGGRRGDGFRPVRGTSETTVRNPQVIRGFPHSRFHRAAYCAERQRSVPPTPHQKPLTSVMHDTRGSSRRPREPIREPCVRSSAASPRPPARPAAAARAPTPSPAPVAAPTWPQARPAARQRRWSGCSAARSSAA